MPSSCLYEGDFLCCLLKVFYAQDITTPQNECVVLNSCEVRESHPILSESSRIRPLGVIEHATADQTFALSACGALSLATVGISAVRGGCFAWHRGRGLFGVPCIPFGLEFAGKVRVLGGQIMQFAHVGGQVIQFSVAAAGVCRHQLPVAVADGPLFAEAPVERLVRRDHPFWRR